MYKQRKNFSILDIPSLEKKKIEARKIFSSMFENLGIEDLNKLYQEKEVPKQNKYTPITATPNTPELKFDTLQNPSNMDAQLKKTYDDTLILGISKPYKVVFTDLDQNKNNIPMGEEVEMKKNEVPLEDEVLAPMDTEDEKVKEENEEDEKEKSDEKTENDDEVSDNYNFLAELPPLDLSADMKDAVEKGGQGMMPNVMINPTFNVYNSQAPASHKGEKIKKIEDDLEGLSVAGLDNDIAFRLF